MRQIIDLILRLADLAEAEGRVARDNLLELSVAVVILSVAAAIFAVGLLAVGAAVAVALVEVMPLPWAIGLVAAALLLTAAILGLFGNRLLRGRWMKRP